MNCLIDQITAKAQQKNKRLEVVARYIRMKYHISIDATAVSRRFKAFTEQKMDNIVSATSSSSTAAAISAARQA